jgi:hypothetical protein
MNLRFNLHEGELIMETFKDKGVERCQSGNWLSLNCVTGSNPTLTTKQLIYKKDIKDL